MVTVSRGGLRRMRAVFRACRGAWMMLGITLVLLLLMEGTLSALFALKDWWRPIPRPDPRVIAEGYGGESWPIRHVRELEQVRERWEPFTYFRQEPFSGQTIHVGPDGLRATWEPPPTDGRKPVRIWFLGGSCAWGFGARDDRTIPSLLARRLHEKGHAVEVRNLAEIGYVSTQEVIGLMRALQDGGERPDLVIFLDGINDLAAAVLERHAGDSTNETHRRREFNLLQTPSRLVLAALVRVVQNSATLRLAQSIRSRLGLASASGQSPVPSSDGALAGDVLRRYAANMQVAEALGRSYGFRCLFFWQPVVFNKPRRTPFEEEERRKYAGLEPICLASAAAIPDIAGLRAHPAFHDLTHTFDDDPNMVYIDYCHTTESANARLAGAIAEAVIPMLESSPARK